MSIASNLSRVKQGLANAYTSLANKGVEIPENVTSDNLVELIENIPSECSCPNGTKWTQSNITSGAVYSIKYADGTWIACVDSLLYYSTDGKIWNNCVNGDSIGCITGNIEYANGLWVTSDNCSYIYYSEDGKTWVNACQLDGLAHYYIKYANGIWVASLSDGVALYYSLDGKTWIASEYSSVTSIINCIINANGIWIASSNNGLYYSLDGKTWARSNITSGRFDIIVYGNGIWVAGSDDGGLYYSLDGKTWTRSNISQRISVFKYANGIWVAGCEDSSYDGLYYSLDGKTWTQSNIDYGGYYVIENANGVWVASCSTSIYYSLDGKIWHWGGIWEGSPKHYIKYANGIWLGDSGNYSIDGKTWINRFSHDDVGNYSIDGKTWIRSGISHGNGEHYAIEYYNGIWITGDDYGIYYSVGWELPLSSTT